MEFDSIFLKSIFVDKRHFHNTFTYIWLIIGSKCWTIQKCRWRYTSHLNELCRFLGIVGFQSCKRKLTCLFTWQKLRVCIYTVCIRVKEDVAVSSVVAATSAFPRVTSQIRHPRFLQRGTRSTIISTDRKPVLTTAANRIVPLSQSLSLTHLFFVFWKFALVLRFFLTLVLHLSASVTFIFLRIFFPLSQYSHCVLFLSLFYKLFFFYI